MSTTLPKRSYGRAPNDLRPTVIEPGFVRPAAGSALISVGETRVICTASVQENVPRWLVGPGRRQRGDDRGRWPGRGSGHRRADPPVPGASRRVARAGGRRHRHAPRSPGRGGRSSRAMSRADVSSLVLGTRNPHKVREIERLLAPGGIAVEPLPEGIELPPEDGATFAENALPKARTAALATGRPAREGDSGVETGL